MTEVQVPLSEEELVLLLGKIEPDAVRDGPDSPAGRLETKLDLYLMDLEGNR